MNIIHYLDDFLIIENTYDKCLHGLNVFLEVCKTIDVPIANEKTVLPVKTIQFLGLEIDSEKGEIRLPPEKLDKCRTLILNLISQEKATLVQLQQVLGLLNFACSVIVPGRAFLQSTRILTKGLKKPHFKKRLTNQSKADLKVWLEFLENHNGVSIYREQMFLSPGITHIYTDSSQNIGLGAVLGRQWFAKEWPTKWWKEQNITLLEFVPILLAIWCWKNILQNKIVIFHTDNSSLVNIINKQFSEEPFVRTVLRGFVLSLLKYNILAKAEHISGKHNLKADALSRNLFTQFKTLHPAALAQPSPVPALPTSLISINTWTTS